MIPRAILLCSVLVAAGLAGCADDADTDPTPSTTPTSTPSATPATTPTPTATPTSPTPDGEAPEYTLTADEVPGTVIAGETFEFTLTVDGTPEVETDHIGAHYDVAPHPEPQGAYGQGCQHQEGTVPGVFTVSCSFAETGTYYLRGHVRVNLSGTLHNAWTDEFTIVAREPVGEYDVTMTDAPTLPVAAGSSFNFTLTIEGDATDFSDHIGGHFGMNSTDEPTVPQYPLGCQHVEGEVPGVFEITCPVPATATPGTYYLRGHMRITVNGEAHDFWADEHSFVVV